MQLDLSHILECKCLCRAPRWGDGGPCSHTGTLWDRDFPRFRGAVSLAVGWALCKSRAWKKIINLPLEIPLGREAVEVLGPVLVGAVPTGLKKG